MAAKRPAQSCYCHHRLLESITVVGCWAHLRRKFDEALKSILEKGWAESLTLIGKKYLTGFLSLSVGLPSFRRRSVLKNGRKPFVIGRKNWLFSNRPKGAKASAVIYSVIETVKENGLNPYDYLTDIFRRTPNIDIRNPGFPELLLPITSKPPLRSDSPVAVLIRSV